MPDYQVNHGFQLGLKHASPLDTLVRRTSSRQATRQAPVRPFVTPPSRPQPPSDFSSNASSPNDSYYEPRREEHRDYYEHERERTLSGERSPVRDGQRSPASPSQKGLSRQPSSPLLHTRFRNSTATTQYSRNSVDLLNRYANSTLDDSQSFQYQYAHEGEHDHGHSYGDDDSVYSNPLKVRDSRHQQQQRVHEVDHEHSHSHIGEHGYEDFGQRVDSYYANGPHSEQDPSRRETVNGRQWEGYDGIPSMYGDGHGAMGISGQYPEEQALPRRSSDEQVDPYAFHNQRTEPFVPTVIVSQPEPPPPAQDARYSSSGSDDASSYSYSYPSHPYANATSPQATPTQGRAPITNSYFSTSSLPLRPARPSDEDKRRVLERNAHRSPAQSMLSPNSARRPQPRSGPRSPSPLAAPPSTTSAPSYISRTRSHGDLPSSSSSPYHPPPSNPHPDSYFSSASSSTPHLSTADDSEAMAPSRPAPIKTNISPYGGDLKPASPGSLYSSYSYYPYQSPVPSPVSATHRGNTSQPTNDNNHGAPPLLRATSTPSPSPSPLSTTIPRGEPNLTNPQTAEDFLQLGITHHEANRLSESAKCFEKAATLPGGNGEGMLMWGLTLRHGWGCESNERAAFGWLRKAAEAAVEDLERVRYVVAEEAERAGPGGKGVKAEISGAIKGELVLAIYEVGQCFLRGWGVKKDQKMAVVGALFFFP